MATGLTALQTSHYKGGSLAADSPTGTGCKETPRPQLASLPPPSPVFALLKEKHHPARLALPLGRGGAGSEKQPPPTNQGNLASGFHCQQHELSKAGQESSISKDVLYPGRTEEQAELGSAWIVAKALGEQERERERAPSPMTAPAISSEKYGLDQTLSLLDPIPTTQAGNWTAHGKALQATPLRPSPFPPKPLMSAGLQSYVTHCWSCPRDCTGLLQRQAGWHKGGPAHLPRHHRQVSTSPAPTSHPLNAPHRQATQGSELSLIIGCLKRIRGAAAWVGALASPRSLVASQN